jgi:hypothetical protein
VCSRHPLSAYNEDDRCGACTVAARSDLQAEVLLSMALHARAWNRPAEAVNLAESALTVARGLDPSIGSRLSMEVAVAAAQQRDAEKFQRQRGRAWRLLEKAPETDRPAWLQFLDPQALKGMEALGLLHLEQYAEAADLFGDAITGRQHKDMRNRARETAKLATALLRANQRDEAIAVVHHGLPLFTEVNSARLAGDLGEVRTALRPYARTSADAADCRDVLSGLLQPAGMGIRA